MKSLPGKASIFRLLNKKRRIVFIEPCEPCIAVECDSQMEQELQYDNVTVSVLKVNDLDAIEFPPSSNVYDFDDDWRSEVYSLDEGNDPDAVLIN